MAIHDGHYQAERRRKKTGSEDSADGSEDEEGVLVREKGYNKIGLTQTHEADAEDEPRREKVAAVVRGECNRPSGWPELNLKCQHGHRSVQLHPYDDHFAENCH